MITPYGLPTQDRQGQLTKGEWGQWTEMGMWCLFFLKFNLIFFHCYKRLTAFSDKLVI